MNLQEVAQHLRARARGIRKATKAHSAARRASHRRALAAETTESHPHSQNTTRSSGEQPITATEPPHEHLEPIASRVDRRSDPARLVIQRPSGRYALLSTHGKPPSGSYATLEAAIAVVVNPASPTEGIERRQAAEIPGAPH